MGLFSSIVKLFRKDTQVDECCADGVCTCSSEGNDLVSDPAVSINTDTSLNTVELESDSCCKDGICTCSSDGNDPVSDSTVVSTASTSSGTVTFSSSPFVSTSNIAEFTAQPVISVEKPTVTATEDEINIALETAAEADRIAAENYTPTPPPVSPPKKKKSNTKKASLKLNRKSSVKRKN